MDPDPEKHWRNDPDYYFIVLRVSPDASLDEIKAAYRRLSRDVHPDVSGGPGTDAAFLLVRRAFDTLSDPDRRRRYDAFRSQPAGSPFEPFDSAGPPNRPADSDPEGPPEPWFKPADIDFGIADPSRRPLEKVVLLLNSGSPATAFQPSSRDSGTFWKVEFDEADEDSDPDVIAVLIVTEAVSGKIGPGLHTDELELLVDDIPVALPLSIVVPDNYFAGDPYSPGGSGPWQVPLIGAALLAIVVAIVFVATRFGSGGSGGGTTAPYVPPPAPGLAAGSYPLNVVDQGEASEVTLVSLDVSPDRTVTVRTRWRNISNGPLEVNCQPPNWPGTSESDNAQLFFSGKNDDYAYSIGTECTGLEDSPSFVKQRGETMAQSVKFAPDSRLQPGTSVTMYWRLRKFGFSLPYGAPAAPAPAPAAAPKGLAGDWRGTANWGLPPLEGVQPREVNGPGELRLELWGVDSPNPAATGGYLSLKSKANNTTTSDCGWYVVSRFDAPLTGERTTLRTTRFVSSDFYQATTPNHAVCNARDSMRFELVRLSATTIAYKMYADYKANPDEALVASGTLTLTCPVMDMRSAKCS